MLVSAAMEPYRKSYGNAERSSATLEGSSESDRITASPRKMCVPGVQAWATDGVSMSSSRTADSTLAAETARDEARDIPRALNADALTLPAYCFAEIVELVLHHIVDGFARGIHVVAHLIDHVIDRYSVDELAAAIHRGPETALGARTRPAGAFHGAISGPPRTL